MRLAAIVRLVASSKGLFIALDYMASATDETGSSETVGA